VIPYGHQSIDEADIAAVVSVMRGEWLTQGPAVAEFEAAVVATTWARFAVAFSSGTAALHAAVAVSGIARGDVVVTSPLSFAASANCALYVGARPVFGDVERDTWNLDPERIPEDAEAIVAVHYSGLPLDLRRLTHRPRVVIEDAAQAFGATTPDGPVGNCARSDLCCFSFHPLKTVTTGEGGAVTTNSADLAEALRRFRHHGIQATPDAGGWMYDIERIGFNYRMTDMQATLGVSQLRKLERFLRRREGIAARYRKLLDDLPVGLPPAAPGGFRHAHHIFPVRVPHRREVFAGLRAAGIGVQVHHIPIYRLSAYAALGFDPADYPETERLYAELLTLPLYPDLDDAQQDVVVSTLQNVLREVAS
jgi:dTDP-4-amino-4,6-dideoxygalactose transaminase